MPRTGVKYVTSERGASALAVVLRREEQGPVIAVEFVSARDLVDARAEVWFEAFLRRGQLDVPLETLLCEPQAIHRRTDEGVDVCLGFSLSATVNGGDSGAASALARAEPPVRCVFPRSFLEPVAVRAARRLLDKGVLHTDDRYTYELRSEPASPEFSAAVTAGRRSHSGVVLAPSAAQAGAPAPLPVVHTALAPLVASARPMHADVALPADYPVFFLREALAKAERVARKGAEAHPAIETGGLLLGPLCSCPDTGALFAVVVDVLEATHSEATTYSLTYSGETWARIQTVMRAKQAHPATRGQRILGQVHGHSFLPLEGTEPCADCAAREVCTRTTSFLSADDLAWCRAVFRGEPWQLSQIFGLNARGEGVEAFFGQRGGRLAARGYSVIDHFEA